MWYTTSWAQLSEGHHFSILSAMFTQSENMSFNKDVKG